MPRKLIFQTPFGFARCIENHVEDDHDGGNVVIVGQDTLKPEGAKASMVFDQAVQSVSVTVSYMRDDPMRAWPVSREERAGKRYTICIYEEDAPIEQTPLPPEPIEPEIFPKPEPDA